MRLNRIVFFYSFLALTAAAQSTVSPYTPQQLGFAHGKMVYKGDTTDVLVQSKPGEEEVKKPLFFFCQGSMPQPLIKYSGQDAYGVFPFSPDSLLENYHLVIVGKPFTPLSADMATLNSQAAITDSATLRRYTNRNYLDYYVERNLFIIKKLQRKPWVSAEELVLAGHSEGSSIVAKMAAVYPKVTHVIYSGGNPLGRISSIIAADRSRETYADSTHYGEDAFTYWEEVLADRTNLSNEHGDSYKATFDFSQPSMEYLEKLKIPVLVSYGTKDYSTPHTDYFRAEMLRKGKRNITFQAYVGTEHNFFPVLPDGTTDYSVFNWQNVQNDWHHWLQTQQQKK